MIGNNIEANIAGTTQKTLQEIAQKYNYIFEDIDLNSLSLDKLLQIVISYYESIIYCMPGNVYWLDKHGVTLGCNQNVLKMFRLNSIEDFKHLSFKDMQSLGSWSAKATKSFEQDTLEVIRTGNAKLNVEEPPIPYPDKDPVYFLTSRVPLKNDRDEINGVVGISIDISERKKTEKILQEAKTQAEAANLAKTQFIRNMEHDIRTPFNGIWALADMLYEQEEDQAKKECLAEIANAGKGLLDFCNTILDFSKIESGALPILEKEFNIRQLIEQVCSIERPAISYKKLKFELYIDAELPILFRGDEYRITSILINLLSNAIKFTSKGKIALKVDLAKRTLDKIIIKFMVSDTGIGIPSDRLDYIYEKFSKISASNRNIYQGSGLGLFIIKRFIHELDGEIEVSSHLDQGTEFSFLLPLRLPLMAR